MSGKEQWNYLIHIGKLVSASPEDGRFFTFCAIGALGVLVNLMALKFLLSLFGLNELSGSVIASLLAMINNFFWNDNFTWRGRQQPVLWRRVIQFPQFVIVCGIGIAVTAMFAQAFVLMDWNVYLGQMAGIIVSTAWSFLANNAWTWPEPKGEGTQRRKLVVTQEYAGNSLK